MRTAVLSLLALSLSWGCKREAPPAPEPSPALTVVTAERTDLMLRYRDAAGEWQQTDQIEAVPAEARGAVVVVDLSLSPAERGAGSLVQVFDLRQPDAEGRFPGRLVPRAELERALTAQLAERREARKQSAIIMYSAAWCGVCRKARAFLEQEGLAFVEKDIEKDPGAAQELSRKAQAAGVATGGVPVFDVGGKIISGFDPEGLRRLARGG